MNIAILGATSQIAKDFILSISEHTKYFLTLFARRPEAVNEWLEMVKGPHAYTILDFDSFKESLNYDVVINFVGVGDPAQALEMGYSIFDTTLKFDELVISYLKNHPQCRYIFISSGAAYGSNFNKCATEKTFAQIPINNFQTQDWYGLAKLYAECRHRALRHFSIVDIRIFNYFSHTQNIDARYLIADIIRAIKNKTVLQTSAENIVRDFISPIDFFNLIYSILNAPPTNEVVDCYSKSPVDKFTLLEAMCKRYSLRYDFIKSESLINATGVKPCYYSLNRRAETFGYTPIGTSLENLEKEFDLILSCS